MAKGTAAKQEIFKKMLEVFPGSFMFNNDKELRITYLEDNEPVQIKVTLTAAKDAVCNPNSEANIPGTVFTDADTQPQIEYTEPTAEEKANLSRLISQMF